MSEKDKPQLTELEQLLVGLHVEAVKHLLARVRQGDATAAELAVAVTLLKHNNIEVGTGEAAAPLRQLAVELPFKDPNVSAG